MPTPYLFLPLAIAHCLRLHSEDGALVRQSDLFHLFGAERVLLAWENLLGHERMRQVSDRVLHSRLVVPFSPGFPRRRPCHVLGLGLLRDECLAAVDDGADLLRLVGVPQQAIYRAMVVLQLLRHELLLLVD